MALASESCRVIEAVVECAPIRDGSIEIALTLTRGAAEIVGGATVVTPWRKPPARVSRELIRPIEGGHSDARAMRSDTKVKLLAGIAKARAWLDELIAGRVLDIADLAQRRSAPSDRPQCCSRWPFSPRAWSRPSPTTAYTAASASRVLPICRATGPSSSRCSACKRHGRRARGVGTPRSAAALRSTVGRSTQRSVPTPRFGRRQTVSLQANRSLQTLPKWLTEKVLHAQRPAPRFDAGSRPFKSLIGPFCTFRAQASDMSAVFRHDKTKVNSIIWLVGEVGLEPTKA